MTSKMIRSVTIPRGIQPSLSVLWDDGVNKAEVRAAPNHIERHHITSSHGEPAQGLALKTPTRHQHQRSSLPVHGQRRLTLATVGEIPPLVGSNTGDVFDGKIPIPLTLFSKKYTTSPPRHPHVSADRSSKILIRQRKIS